MKRFIKNFLSYEGWRNSGVMNNERAVVFVVVMIICLYIKIASEYNIFPY